MWVCNGTSASLALPNRVRRPSAKTRPVLALGGILQSVIKFLHGCRLLPGTAPSLPSWVISKRGQHCCWNLSVDVTFLTLGSVFSVSLGWVRWDRAPRDPGNPAPAALVPPLLDWTPPALAASWHAFCLGFPSPPTLLLSLLTTHLSALGLLGIWLTSLTQ